MWNPFRTKVAYAIPEPYSIWESRMVNPYERHKVRVVGVREGYVKYTECYNSAWFAIDRSCTLAKFHENYLEVTNEQQ